MHRGETAETDIGHPVKITEELLDSIAAVINVDKSAIMTTSTAARRRLTHIMWGGEGDDDEGQNRYA